MKHGFLLLFCEHIAQLRSVGCLISLYRLPPNEFLPPMHRLRTIPLAPISILVLSLLPPLHVTGHYGAKRPRKFFKIEASHAKRFYKFFRKAFLFSWIFRPAFKTTPLSFTSFYMQCWSEHVWGGESCGACAPEKVNSNRKPPPPSRRRSRPSSRPGRGRAGPQKDAKSRQLFRLLIISTTVKPIFCCICNNRSSICTT